MLRLFLQNYEIELTEDIQVAITKQFEDITNPTSIINDWSKTVKIPATSTNNKIFGHLNNVDKLTVSESGTIGVYFDPYKKIDFRLQWGDAIVMTGYAKNVSCAKDYYNLTLNGELGKVFQEMKKITFDKSTEDTKYLIDGSLYIDETINKDLIYRLWNNEPDFDNLKLVDKYIWSINATTGEKEKQANLEYKTQNYLGFAPNNAFEEDFDYKTFQKNNQNTSMKLSEVLDERVQVIENNTEATYQSVVGIAADTVIGDGMLPRDIGEYRSYMQLPYIYWNKLFQIFTEKAKEITGYDCILNQDWFNYTNPYWSRLVYMLKKLGNDKNAKMHNVYSQSLGTYVNNGHNRYTPSFKSPGVWQAFTNADIESIKTDFTNNKFDTINFTSLLPLNIKLNNCKYTISGSQPAQQTIATQKYAIFANGYRFNVVFRVKNENGAVVYTLPEVPLYTSFNGRFNYDNGVVIDNFPKVKDGYYEININIPFGLYINRSEVGNSFSIEYTIYSVTPLNDVDIIFYGTNTGDYSITSVPSDGVVLLPAEIVFTATNTTLDTSNSKRSFSGFTLNDLWNNEVNLFDEILNYCKMYRIGIFCDYFNKQINFRPLNSFFNDYTIEDWTEKVDLSKDYHIEPITFDNKYVKFNYKKNETDLNKQYNDRFGLNFGEYKLTTQYEFNTSEKELFKDVKSAFSTTDMVLSWENLYTYMKIVYTLPAEINVSNKDKDKKVKDIFGSMLFFNGNKTFDNTNGLRSVSITDDTDFQTLNKTYFYTQNGQEGRYIKSLKYPELDIVYDKQLCTFATPLENYTYKANSYNNKKGIYENFWKNYLDERYNIQNKIVTCYIYLKPSDYINFSFNKFVKINNQIYMVNKIYDYDITSSAPTKVDLITIQNIEGYTEAVTFDWFVLYDSDMKEWNYYQDYVTLTGVNQTKTIYVSSSKPVTWTDTSSALQSMLIYYNNDESNATYASGTIPAGEKIPVTFKMVESYDEFGDVIFKSGDKEYKVSVALIVDKSFTVYDSDKTVWASTDKISLTNTNTTSKTIYITSKNWDVSWDDNGNDLQDLYINGVAGSGTISAGTMVPVTISYDFSETEMLDMPITASIKFYTPDQTTTVNLTIIVDEIFTVYSWNGDVWDDEVDYILLTPTEQTKTIYLSANADVEWSDESNELQNLYISSDADAEDWGSYENGSGTIYPPSNMRPIHFRIDLAGQQGESSGNIIFYNGRHDWIIPVRLVGQDPTTANQITVYNSDKTAWDNHYDYIELEPHTTKTIYMTSATDISWMTDVNIQNNVEVNGEVGQGRIQAGNQVAVNFFNDEFTPCEGNVRFENEMQEYIEIFVRIK